MQRNSLYDDDIILWAEQQAGVLRRLGQARKDLPNDLDLENVIEEIESVGREQLYAVESRLRLILGHLIKLALELGSEAALHWRSEVLNWHGDLLNRFAPSMAGRLNMDRVWRLALRQAMETNSLGRQSLPSKCPVALAELLEEELEIDPLIERLQVLVHPATRPE